jgi:hypothetical protein
MAKSVRPIEGMDSFTSIRYYGGHCKYADAFMGVRAGM